MNLIRLLKSTLLTTILCLPLLVNAQDKAVTINGIFFKKNTPDRIAQATVTDLKTGTIMMSDELGGFNIKTAIGDTLVFNHMGYTPQKQVVTSAQDMVIYMQPIVVLQQVNIKGESNRQELNDVKNQYRSKGLYFDGRPPFMAFIASPITAFYELFSQDAKNERHFIKFSKDEMEAIEVDRRYTKTLVKQVTKLPDDEVVKFMQQYKPSYEDMKQWNDYDLIAHIKKYLLYYNHHKEGIQLQKLY